jgi:DNA N-6-adenine-methyltransferase (Dam)
MSRSSHFHLTARTSKFRQHSSFLPEATERAHLGLSNWTRGAQSHAPSIVGETLERLPALVERLLAEGTPKEIRASRLSVETLRRMAKEAQLGFEAELRCAAARQLLDHRLGEMCQHFLRRGRPKKVADGDHLRLTDIVKNKTQSSRCQEIAKVPISEARRYHQHCLKHQIEITDAGLFEFVNEPGQSALKWHRSGEWHKEQWAKNPGYPSPTATGEWYTPKELFDAMGIEFAIDVASPGRKVVPWIPAKKHYTKRHNGLKQPWYGCIWMNPQFGVRHGIVHWINKFIEHGDGVALVPDFTSTEWWQHLVRHADAVLHVSPKIQFEPQHGGGNALGSTLVAIGPTGVRALQNTERAGRGVCLLRRNEISALARSEKRRYWLLPPEILAAVLREFGPGFVDQCPHPRPEGFNSLLRPWARKNIVNPPFPPEDGVDGKGPTAFIRKAIEEHTLGNAELTIVFAPVQNYVNLALEAAGGALHASAGISVQIRSMGRVRWIDPETGERCPSPGPVAMFIFRSKVRKSAEG